MTSEEKIIKNKVGLVKFGSDLGLSSRQFLSFKEVYDRDGELALQEISRRKPVLKNRVEEHVEKAVMELPVEQPALGQVRVSNELKKRGIFISPGGVRCIWLRLDVETFKKRLKALEAQAAQETWCLLRNNYERWRSETGERSSR